MSEETGEWQTCVVDSDYEIFSEYPYPLRRKGSDKIVSESIDSKGYVQCWMNGKNRQKHRVNALQFIENDDPVHKTCIDHIDHNRTNNHISNLRWVSYADNNKNKSSNHGVEYEYVDAIDDEAVQITDYGKHHFEFYYYVEADDSFYFYNGVNYKKLHVNVMKNNGSTYVFAYNTENKKIKIYINKFKQLYGIDF